MNDGYPVSQPYSRAGLLAKLTGAAVLAAGAFLVGQGTSQLASTGTALTYASGVLTVVGSTPGLPASGQVKVGGGAIKAYGEITCDDGSLRSRLYPANLQLHRTGAASYTDITGIGGTYVIRTSNASSLDTTAMTIAANGDVAFAHALYGSTFSGSGTVVSTNGTGYSRLNPGGDVEANRGDGTGVYYFATGGTKYLYWDGTKFNLSGGTLVTSSGINAGGAVTSTMLTASGAILALGTSAQIDSTASNTATDSRWQFQNGTSTHAVLRIVANNTSTAYIDTFEKTNSSNLKKLALNEYGGDVYVGTDPTGSEKFRVGGAIRATSAVFTGGSSAAASIWKGAADGLNIRGTTGSVYDLTIQNAAGTTNIISVPTGTNNVDFSGDVFVRNATAAIRLIRTTAANAGILTFENASGTKYNWLTGVQYNADNTYEISASSAVGGFTYNQTIISCSYDGNRKIGFLGASAVARPTATGSRGGNAALASLCTALASLGLITDSTS